MEKQQYATLGTLSLVPLIPFRMIIYTATVAWVHHHQKVNFLEFFRIFYIIFKNIL
jgi:hypothetical protein